MGLADAEGLQEWRRLEERPCDCDRLHDRAPSWRHRRRKCFCQGFVRVFLWRTFRPLASFFIHDSIHHGQKRTRQRVPELFEAFFDEPQKGLLQDRRSAACLKMSKLSSSLTSSFFVHGLRRGGREMSGKRPLHDEDIGSMQAVPSRQRQGDAPR